MVLFVCHFGEGKPIRIGLRSVVAKGWGWGEGWTPSKEAQGKVGIGRNFSVNCICGYTTVCIYQNPRNPALKQDEFHVCELILNKYGFKETKEGKELDSGSFTKCCCSTRPVSPWNNKGSRETQWVHRDGSLLSWKVHRRSLYSQCPPGRSPRSVCSESG